MVQLAALIGCQALSEYRVMLGAALTVGVTPVEAKEIVYQAVPYAGMGKVFDFIHATNDDTVRTRRPAATRRTGHDHGRHPRREGPGCAGADHRGGPDRAHVRVGGR